MSTIKRIYRDGTMTRVATNEPVNVCNTGSNGVSLSRFVTPNAILIANDNPKTANLLTGSELLKFRIMNKEDDYKGDLIKNHGLMEVKGNVVVNDAYDVYDNAGRIYERSFEFKTNGYKELGAETTGNYRIDVSLSIVIQRKFDTENITGNRLVLTKDCTPINGIGTGKILYIIKYKQIFNTNNFIQGVVDSNYYGSFDGETADFVRINGSIFDTNDQFVEPEFKHSIDGENVVISTTYSIGELSSYQYGNFYYDIQLMSSKHIVVKNWEYSVIVSEIQN
jgi:hypothetical protein